MVHPYHTKRYYVTIIKNEANLYTSCKIISQRHKMSNGKWIKWITQGKVILCWITPMMRLSVLDNLWKVGEELPIEREIRWMGSWAGAVAATLYFMWMAPSRVVPWGDPEGRGISCIYPSCTFEWDNMDILCDLKMTFNLSIHKEVRIRSFFFLKI